MYRYKGFDLEISADVSDGSEILLGKAAGILGYISCHGKTLPQLKENFRKMVDKYLERCEKAGKAPEKPFPGRILLRTDPETHRRIYLAAAQNKQSINTWLEELVKEHVPTDESLMEELYFVDSSSKSKTKQSKKQA